MKLCLVLHDRLRRYFSMSNLSDADRLRIPVDQLAIGMYVVELDRAWTETAFLFQGFRIRQQQEIRLLQEICQYVWVDARRSVGIRQQARENQAAQEADLQPLIGKVSFSAEMAQADAGPADAEHSPDPEVLALYQSRFAIALWFGHTCLKLDPEYPGLPASLLAEKVYHLGPIV